MSTVSKPVFPQHNLHKPTVTVTSSSQDSSALAGSGRHIEIDYILLSPPRGSTAATAIAAGGAAAGAAAGATAAAASVNLPVHMCMY